jgi:hypothetical protein
MSQILSLGKLREVFLRFLRDMSLCPQKNKKRPYLSFFGQDAHHDGCVSFFGFFYQLFLDFSTHTPPTFFVRDDNKKVVEIETIILFSHSVAGRRLAPMFRVLITILGRVLVSAYFV